MIKVAFLCSLNIFIGGTLFLISFLRNHYALKICNIKQYFNSLFVPPHILHTSKELCIPTIFYAMTIVRNWIFCYVTTYFSNYSVCLVVTHLGTATWQIVSIIFPTYFFLSAKLYFSEKYNAI